MFKAYSVLASLAAHTPNDASPPSPKRPHCVYDNLHPPYHPLHIVLVCYINHYSADATLMTQGI
jgi:hypothetical protein